MLTRLPEIDELTDDQLRVFNDTFEKNAVLVSGGPWTWKSTLIWLMASWYKKEMESEGRKNNCVVISYNKNLQNYTQELFKIPTSTLYTHLNRLTHFIEEYYLALKKGGFIGDPQNQKSPYRESLKKLKEDSWNSTRTPPGPWDIFYLETASRQQDIIRSGRVWGDGRSLVCVDEWQDLLPASYEMLKRLHKGIYVFMDDGQRIKSEGASRDDVINCLSIWELDCYHLTQNHRNTKQVHDLLYSLRTTEDRIQRPERNWTKPKLYVKTEKAEIVEFLVSLFRSLKPTSVWNRAIVVKKKETRDALYAYLSESGIPNLQCVKTDSSQSGEEDRIMYEKYDNFILCAQGAKGLEFHEVVLVDVDRSWLRDNALYVAWTRASEQLHIIVRTESDISDIWLKEEYFDRCTELNTRTISKEDLF